MPHSLQSNNTWHETAEGTASGATATHDAVAGKTHIVRHLSGHTDADSILQILGGVAGATVLWESKLDVSLEGFHFEFSLEDGVLGTADVAVAGVIVSSTADCEVNISGYSFP